MDGMLTFEEKVLIPHGANRVEEIDKDTFREVAQILNGQNLLTSYGEDGITSYVLFGSSESLLVISSREPHARLGNGVLFRLFLPPEVIPSDMEINGNLVLDMNTDEATAWLTGHCLGSWCLGPVGSGRFTPTYVSFMPAFACAPEVIVNTVFSMLGHNTWAEGYFFAYDRVKQKRTPIKS
ncbi:MAG: hypothetical protein PVF79_06010 [Desulfobacterales bacterium]|jgi:hypothetical protein